MMMMTIIIMIIIIIISSVGEVERYELVGICAEIISMGYCMETCHISHVKIHKARFSCLWKF